MFLHPARDELQNTLLDSIVGVLQRQSRRETQLRRGEDERGDRTHAVVDKAREGRGEAPSADLAVERCFAVADERVGELSDPGQRCALGVGAAGWRVRRGRRAARWRCGGRGASEGRLHSCARWGVELASVSGACGLRAGRAAAWERETAQLSLRLREGFGLSRKYRPDPLVEEDKPGATASCRFELRPRPAHASRWQGTHPASPSSLTFSQTVRKISQFSPVWFSSVAFAAQRAEAGGAGTSGGGGEVRQRALVGSSAQTKAGRQMGTELTDYDVVGVHRLEHCNELAWSASDHRECPAQSERDSLSLSLCLRESGSCRGGVRLSRVALTCPLPSGDPRQNSFGNQCL